MESVIACAMFTEKMKTYTMLLRIKLKCDGILVIDHLVKVQICYEDKKNVQIY